MYHDLTKGSISRSLLLFSLPMMAGNLLQQFYNVADTLVVGRVLGGNALAAVGSSYTLMTFLTSIFLGLSMGSGALFSIYQGKGDKDALKSSICHAFCLILSVTVLLNIAIFLLLRPILSFLRVPAEVWDGMRQYLAVIFAGIIATSLYNFFSCLLRSLGNSTVPLVFLAVSALLNIALDILFVAYLPLGIRGAAYATVIAQYVSGVGILLYVRLRCPEFFPSLKKTAFSRGILKELGNLSFLTCLQQSVMNFGILLVQGLVNSFGPTVMAAFAAAVKINTFAYLPVQDFGNAYSTFVAQNYGAGIGTASGAAQNSRFLSASASVSSFPPSYFFLRSRSCSFSSVRKKPLSSPPAFSICVSKEPLLRDRLSVFALRLLPRCKTRRNVRYPHSHLPRSARCARLCAVRHFFTGNRHLARHPHRLGHRRHYRACLYEDTAAKREGMTLSFLSLKRHFPVMIHQRCVGHMRQLNQTQHKSLCILYPHFDRHIQTVGTPYSGILPCIRNSSFLSPP